MPVRPVGEIRELARARSVLGAERTEAVLAARFGAVPRRLEAALRRWPLGEARVLDVGCSYGHCLVHFGPGSVGIDNDPEHVEFGRSLGLDVRPLDVDEGLGELPDGAFDVVWISDILEHLDSPRLVLRRLRSKLAQDGRLILFVTLLPRSRLARWALRRRGAPFDSAAHHYQFTLETARYVVERAGYRVVSVEVPPAPRWAGRLLAAQAPRAFLEAVPDEAAAAVAEAGERKNKPLA